LRSKAQGEGAAASDALSTQHSALSTQHSALSTFALSHFRTPALPHPHRSNLNPGSTPGRAVVVATAQPVAYIQRVMRVSLA
jgi:hypothetical protein